MLPARLERAFRRPPAADRPPLNGRPSRRETVPPTGVRQRRRQLGWTRAARRRRLLFGVLVLIPTIIASGFMLQVLPHQGRTLLEQVIAALFGALFGWISIGFWTATMGFFLLVFRRDRFAVTNAIKRKAPLDQSARTAVVMPICEEPVERVFAGLRAIYRSLERAGHLELFDLFILSDTADPGAWLREEEAWARLCNEVDGFGRIFYRRRRVRVKRKSGNVAEFCRAWGSQYRYMVVVDADSVMSGATITDLVRCMEGTPNAGLIQTVPSGFGRRSLYGRMQQFTMRAYGPIFSAGLHFWQLGDGQYWGHNAILRVAPFMEHCGLGRLPGKPPLGGEILSHDFVEAALLGRAGWTLWLAYDLPGSYEQIPSSLLEEMKRDRRWCQGNLQHLRLVSTKGLFGAHRALFLNGALSYVSALLWFAFLVASSAEALLEVLYPTDYFPSGRSLFPQWPVWRPDWALALLAVTLSILFLPKVLGLLLIAIRGRTRSFGGATRLISSAVAEVLLSSLLAPIRMVFHTRFVALNLIGRTVAWHSSRREDSETSWEDAMRHHGFDSGVASAWAVVLYLLNPDYFWWVLPIVLALVLSVPISVLSSRVPKRPKKRLRRLFVIPEETEPPPEIAEVYERLAAASAEPGEPWQDPLVRCAVDPYTNALHRSLLGAPRRLRSDVRQARNDLLEHVLEEGPQSATTAERRLLLSDPELVDALHDRVWTTSDGDLAERWQVEPVEPSQPGAASATLR
jgi:membrane glycosyltransferase